MDKKLAFLHIPKTAGQTVHASLVDIFGDSEVSKIRVNSQFNDQTLINGYSETVYSGHLDWSKLEDVLDELVVFTILRNPKDRILSFYHYLRLQAQKLSEQELQFDHNRGMKNILVMSPNEYFCPNDNNFKKFIDEHYDNFYTRYFAYKRYSGTSLDNSVEVLKVAMRNLNSIDGIYTIDTWGEVGNLIKKHFDKDVNIDVEKRVNVGNGSTTEERIKQLSLIGPSELAIERIYEMTRLDDVLYEYAYAINDVTP